MLRKNSPVLHGAAVLALLAFSGGREALAAVTGTPASVQALKEKIAELEVGLSSARQTEASLDGELGKLKNLLKLQQLEIQVGQGELKTMEQKLQETEAKKAELDAALSERKKKLRQQLSQLPAMRHANPIAKMHGDDGLMASIHVGMIDKLVQAEREEILQLKKLQEELAAVDEKLREENLKISGHVEDLKEKQNVLALNREVSTRRLEQVKADEAARLREFREAKVSERKLEAMMTSLGDEEENSRPLAAPSAAKPPRQVIPVAPKPIVQYPAIVAVPVPPPAPAPKAAARPAAPAAPVAAAANSAAGNSPAGRGNFFDRKGQLPLPVSGAVISGFGKKYDAKTNLYTFHKGIEIAAKSSAPVRAVYPGRVAFAGRLGGYRNLVIIDHGKQFYSLAGNLGETLRKAGDVVREGEVIGSSAADETPLYFEIRQRHIAVNPVPWFRDLKQLARAGN